MCTTTGANSSCNITQKINAIGEAPLVLDPEKEPAKKTVQSLGTIVSPNDIYYTLPAAGETKILSFMPSKGLMGSTLYVAFTNKLQRPGTRLAGKSVITVNRLIKGQKPNEWQLAGIIEAEGTGTSRWDFTIEPDGTLKGVNPKDKSTVEIHLGERNLAKVAPKA